MRDEERVRVVEQDDAATARRAARALAAAVGFDSFSAEEIILAVSELASNLARYGQRGEIVLRQVDGPRGPGVEIESRDSGPGIGDLVRAMEDGYSTGGGLGGGLPGVRRLMDEFAIDSGPAGTKVLARKWVSRG